jgi:hypothetical protein
MGLTPGSITTLETEQRWDWMSNRPHGALPRLRGRPGRERGAPHRLRDRGEQA